MPQETCPGSITQWISVCNCGALAGLNEDKRPRCRTCGKPLIQRRPGSMTQWFFQQDACNCEQPDVYQSVDTAKFKPASFRGFETEDEKELFIEDGRFPVERYKPLALLGYGGSGIVYLGRDRLLGKLVAVKVLKSLEAEALVAFQNEARTTSKLTHPNIVKVLDFGSTADGGVPFMVMEYVPGESLEEILKQVGTISTEQAIAIFTVLADTLDYAHSVGVLHRDLKPSNILVVELEDGTLQSSLIDFGVAKLQEHMQSTTIYNGTTMVGTPAYMSPDMALGHEFDHRSDLYSLGCVLFESLVGRPPFIADSALELISMHVHAPPPSILDYIEHNPTTIALSDIVEKCLAKRAENRFQYGRAFKVALLTVTSGAPLAADSTQSKQEKLQGVPLYTIAAVLLPLLVIAAVSYNMLGDQSNKRVNSDLNENASRAKKLSLKIYGTEEWLKADLEFGDADMHVLKQYKNFPCISLQNSTVTGKKGFEVLAKLSAEKLKLADTLVQDDAMRYVAQMKNLERLWLDTTPITDRGIELLRSAKNLKGVTLSETAITDKGLEYLSKFPTLELVDLRHCFNITDNGIRKLGTSKRIKVLILGDNYRISPKAVEDFASQPGLQREVNYLPQPERALEFGSRRSATRMLEMSMDLQEDPQVLKILREPKNWQDNADLSKIKNPRALKWLSDPVFRKNMKDPIVRRKWSKPETWDQFAKDSSSINGSSNLFGLR